VLGQGGKIYQDLHALDMLVDLRIALQGKP
jgi:hypothetical protein